MRFPTPVFQAPDNPSTPSASGTLTESVPDSGTTPSSTPSTSPVTPTPGSPPSPPDVASSPSDGVDSSLGSFEFMFGPEGEDPLEVGGLGSSPLGTVPPEPKPAQPVQTPSVPVAQVQEPAKPDPSIATPAPTEATSPTTPEGGSPNLDPFDPGTLAQHLAQNEQEVIQQLSDGLFKLSDKDVEALESDTVGTIPKLLARTFVASQRNFLMQMARIVPMMVQRHGEVTRRHSEAEGEFYTRWPDIKKDQHRQLVMQYAAVYRQMHPQTSRKDMIEAIGPMVMMAANIKPSGVLPPAQPNGQPSPMVNGGGRPPQPAPFVPAGPSAGGSVLSTAPQPSVIEAMFADHDQ